MIRVSISFLKYVTRYYIGTLRERENILEENNHHSQINKTLSKEIMKRTKLRNNCLKSGTEEIQKNTPSKETLVHH